jgi:DNA-directed RNA polymerase subunit RPC12/RpoP
MKPKTKSFLHFAPAFVLENLPEIPRQKFKPRPMTREQWRELKIARREAERKQLEGIESQDIFKLCIEGKLEQAGAREYCSERQEKWFENFLRCGREKFFVMCAICESGHEAFYQCSLKWCPRCNWRISMKRRELLAEMTKGMRQVKHVVLTQKNFETLTKEKIQAVRKALAKLVRQKIFGNVSGGCASLEFTNEGNGWHMHWHLLLQTKWVEAHQLSIAWGNLVGQEFAIVKVKDISEKSYLQELCKYVVEGSELSKWPPDKILQFVSALRGTRCFTAFGKFRELQKIARENLLDRPKREADCACKTGEWIVGNDFRHCQRIALKKGY